MSLSLEDVTPGAQIAGITGDTPVTVVAATWIGGNALRLTYRTEDGRLDERILYRDHEPRLSVPRTSPAPEPPPGPKNTRFYGTARLDPERYVRDFNKLYQEVIQHLAAPDGVDLETTVEISASKRDGYPDDKARIVTENARTLKFEQYGFEDH
jgi:hypothetical protein